MYNWPAQLFVGKRFAAFHLEIDVRDEYDRWDYTGTKNPLSIFPNKKPKYELVGPKPSFYWLFRQEAVRNTPRLFLDFASGIEDVLYGDKRLISECIRWLNLPLQEATSSMNIESNCKEVESNINIKETARLPSQFANSERILHIGSEQSTLNMGQIIHLVKKLVTVSSFGSLL